VSEIQHFAFKNEYPDLSLRLITEVKNSNVTVCNLVRDVDLLIGMDIIQLGDFVISNGAGKTLFTFAMPPFEDKIDLYKRSIKAVP